MFNKIVCRVLTVIAITSLSLTKTESVRANELYGGDCPDAPARLNQGDIAVISDEAGTKGLNLRVQPGIKNDIIMSIPLYAYVTIIAGPKCNDGYRWYEVGYNGQDGWSAEVGQDGIYNLIPDGQPMPETIETPGGQSENSQQASRPDVYPDSFLGTWVNNKAWCIDSQKGFNCSVEVEITRQPDGKQAILLKIDSKVINSSSEQGIYQQFCMVDSCWWTYVFLLDGIEAYMNPTDEGKLNFGYYKPDIGVGTTLTLVDKPVANETQVPNQSQPAPLVEAPVEAPTEEKSFFCSILPLFCPAETNARSRPFKNYQCTWYVATKRLDVWTWIPNTNADAKTWGESAKKMGVPVDSTANSGFSISNIKVGDIIVLQPGTFGALDAGHVAYVESVDYQTGKILVSEYNGLKKLAFATRYLTIVPGMTGVSFIHKDPLFDQQIPQDESPSGSKKGTFWEWLSSFFK